VLAANAMKAFARLGIQDKIMEKGRLLDAFVIKDLTGRTLTRTNSLSMSQKYGADNFTIHRADLHQALVSHLAPAQIKTNKRCEAIAQQGDTIRMQFSDNTTETADFLLACDGIRSPIRQQLLPTSRTRYAGYTCWRAVVSMPDLHLTEATETWGATRPVWGCAAHQ